MQVYKAVRRGVQDVALKVLLCNDEEQLLAFEKVRSRLLHGSRTVPETPQAWHKPTCAIPAGLCCICTATCVATCTLVCYDG